MAVAKKRAYNRRKLTDSVPAEPPVSKVSLKDPVAMRNRIAEINQIAAELHKERTVLEEAIIGLGFKMVDAPSKDPAPKDWKAGYVLRCINENGDSLTEDKLYITTDDTNGDNIEVDDDDGDRVLYPTKNFAFVAR